MSQPDARYEALLRETKERFPEATSLEGFMEDGNIESLQNTRHLFEVCEKIGCELESAHLARQADERKAASDTKPLSNAQVTKVDLPLFEFTQLLYRYAEAGKLLSLSVAAVEDEVKTGRLKVVYPCPRSPRITVDALREYIRMLQEGTEEEQAAREKVAAIIARPKRKYTRRTE